MSNSPKLSQHEVETRYAEILKKYAEPEEINYSDVDQINDDILEAIDLTKISHESESPFTLKPSVSSVFLQNDQLFQRIQDQVFRNLSLASPYLTELAIESFNTAPLSREYLDKKFESLAEKRKKLSDEAQVAQLQQDLALIKVLFSAEQHLEHYCFDELVAQFAKTQGAESIAQALELAAINASLRAEVLALFDQEFIKYREVCKAASRLSVKDLTALFPDQEAQKLFLSRLGMHQPAWLFAQGGQVNTLYWAIQQAVNLDEPKTLNELIEKSAQYNPQALYMALQDQKVLAAIPQEKLSSLFILIGIPPEVQHEIITIIIDNADYMKTLEPGLVYSLCLAANLNQLEDLLANDHVRRQFLNYSYKGREDSAIYALLSKATKDGTEVNQQKANYIYEEYDNFLEDLLPAHLLTLSTNENLEHKIDNQRAIELLARKELWQKYTPEKSVEVNGDALRGIRRKQPELFNAFMQHDIYKEAWLRSLINEPQWDTVGQGFFKKKTPTTIANARAFLKEKGYQPLAKTDLQTLLNMFKDASQHSHAYFCGLVDFRDSNTQKFYDIVASLPDVNLDEHIPTPKAQ